MNTYRFEKGYGYAVHEFQIGWFSQRGITCETAPWAQREIPGTRYIGDLYLVDKKGHHYYDDMRVYV
jgi:hypothetical protein